MKILGKLLLILIILAVALVLVRDVFLQFAIETGVEFATGLPLKMKSVNLNLSQTNIGIKDLKIYNPAGFPDSVMVDMPVIFVDFNLANILKGNMHLEDIKIYLKEFSVVKSADGRLNVNSIKTVQQSQKAPVSKKEPSKPAKAPMFQIDKMDLKVDRVTYKDFRGAGDPSVKTFNINLNEEYQNVTDLNQLIGIIVFKVMTKTPVAALTGFDMGGLQTQLSDTLSSAKKIASDTVMVAQGTLKQAGEMVAAPQDVAKNAAGDVSDATKGLLYGLKSETSGLKDKLKNPFSKSES